MASYPYKLRPDDNDTYLISFPDFPEAHTWAEDLEEAAIRARDAIDTAIQGRISDKEPIPEPRATAKSPAVTLGTLRAAKVGLWNIMRKQDMTKARLARKLKWPPVLVDRLFDPRHPSRVALIEDAAAALSAEVSLTITPPKPARKTAKGARAA